MASAKKKPPSPFDRPGPKTPRLGSTKPVDPRLGTKPKLAPGILRGLTEDLGKKQKAKDAKELKPGTFKKPKK